jgi:hypothetical protein
MPKNLFAKALQAAFAVMGLLLAAWNVGCGSQRDLLLVHQGLEKASATALDTCVQGRPEAVDELSALAGCGTGLDVARQVGLQAFTRVETRIEGNEQIRQVKLLPVEKYMTADKVADGFSGAYRACGVALTRTNEASDARNTKIIPPSPLARSLCEKGARELFRALVQQACGIDPAVAGTEGFETCVLKREPVQLDSPSVSNDGHPASGGIVVPSVNGDGPGGIQLEPALCRIDGCS